MNEHRLSVTHPNGRYDVLVGIDLLPRLADLAQITGPVALITDSHVASLQAPRCSAVACQITIPAGERHKTLATVQAIYDQMLAAGLDRKATVVALGGGVVGDVAGFVAATYLRGINFVQCPTTLLAMVDASVGGKTGVDLPQGKNLVGAFKQPTAVLADVTTLQTLPAAEFAAGMAELIKHGLIADPDLLQKVANWPAPDDPPLSLATLQALVAQAIDVKRQIVQEDPYEHGRRALLNLGHTFAHAIEQVSEYGVGHGQAVAMGLVAASNLSARLGYCDPALQTQVEKLLTIASLPTRIPATLPAEAIYAAMGSDKKKAGGRLRFVLLRGVGELLVAEGVEKTAVVATLRELASGE